jgi:DNA replication protein DnaC
MAYPNELYRKAERILEKRREDSALEAEIRSSEIKQKIPEVEEIQQQLSRIGLELSQIFLYKQDASAKVSELRAKSEALVEKRGIILKNNGYKENSMAPVHICPACEDRGFISGRMCSCHKQLLKELAKNQIRSIAPIDECTFDNFSLDYYSDEPLDNSIVPRSKAEIILESSRRYAQNFSMNSKNLLFMGGTGLGKTHLSLAIANVVINRGYYVCYGTSQNICDDLQAEQFGRGDDAVYSKKNVLGCDLLIIDDLGTELDNQYSIASLYNIINSRILSKKPTIISTNYSFSQLQAKYDQRITSRLSGEYVALYIFGSDIRNIK